MKFIPHYYTEPIPYFSHNHPLHQAFASNLKCKSGYISGSKGHEIKMVQMTIKKNEHPPKQSVEVSKTKNKLPQIH